MTTTSCDCDKCHIVWTIEWPRHEHGDFAIPEPQTITLCEHRRRRIRGSVSAISFRPYPGFACNECIRLKHAERLAAIRLGGPICSHLERGVKRGRIAACFLRRIRSRYRKNSAIRRLRPWISSLACRSPAQDLPIPDIGCWSLMQDRG